MNDQIGPQSGRLRQRGRAKAVVNGQQRARAMRQFGQRADVADFGQRVGRRFGKQQPGIGLERRLPLGQVGLRHERAFNPKLGEFTADQPDGRAKHRLRADHMVAAFEQPHAHQQDRRHAAGSANAGLGAFHRGQALLHARNRGVAETRIDVALFLVGKAPRGRGGIGLDKAAGQIQRFRVFSVLAFVNGRAHGQGVQVQVFG